MKRIGTISNYYGGVFVMQKDNKYYWLIEDHDTDFDNLSNWTEIDKQLFDELNAYEERRKK